jgi:hypothetical protein
MSRILERHRPANWDKPGSRGNCVRYEPFCTVLLELVSEAIAVSKGSLPAKPDVLTYPLGTGPTQTKTGFARPPRSSS